jgi:hypothetical protein
MDWNVNLALIWLEPNEQRTFGTDLCEACRVTEKNAQWEAS